MSENLDAVGRVELMSMKQIRRIQNRRLKVYGLDNSDINFTTYFWLLFFAISMLLAALPPLEEYGLYFLYASFASAVPMAMLVKVLKSGKNTGHLEFIKYAIFNLKEGRKNKIISIYNIRKSGFLNKTLSYLKKGR